MAADGDATQTPPLRRGSMLQAPAARGAGRSAVPAAAAPPGRDPGGAGVSTVPEPTIAPSPRRQPRSPALSVPAGPLGALAWPSAPAPRTPAGGWRWLRPRGAGRGSSPPRAAWGAREGAGPGQVSEPSLRGSSRVPRPTRKPHRSWEARAAQS
jgi:hypothetical protein